MSSPLDTNSVSLCARCKQKPSDFKCDECLPGGTYCANCDGYLHSLPSKRTHNRTIINPPSFPSSLPLPYPSSSPSYSLNSPSNPQLFPSHQPQSQTQSYINEIKQIYESEKRELQSKIDSLTTELITTKKTLNERIDFLHQHLDENNQTHKKQINHLNANHINELKTILSEKDSQITKLIEDNKHLHEANTALQSKVTEYENILQANNVNHNKELTQLNSHLNTLNQENSSIELFFKKKIEEINAVHENEKNNIISSYEHTVDKLNQGYVESKEKYANIIKQREDYIKELINEHQKEINDLNDIITKLKECNNSSKSDQEELIKMNDVLKQTLTNTNNELNDIKKELKRNEKEKKKMGSTITKLSTKNEELRVGNEKLHGIVYGKFKHK